MCRVWKNSRCAWEFWTNYGAIIGLEVIGRNLEYIVRFDYANKRYRRFLKKQEKMGMKIGLSFDKIIIVKVHVWYDIKKNEKCMIVSYLVWCLKYKNEKKTIDRITHKYKVL